MNNKKYTTKDMVVTSLLIAIIYICTAINIPSPFSLSSGGMIHLGNIAFFTSVLVFGRFKGAIAGGIGMALLDLTSAYAIWAPFTLIIRGFQGLILGSIAYSRDKKGNSVGLNIVAIIVAGIFMLFGYYIAEVILYGNFMTPFFSMPGDVIQIVIGLVIAIPLSKGIKKVIK